MSDGLAKTIQFFLPEGEPRDGVECDGKGYLSDDGFTVCRLARAEEDGALHRRLAKSARRELMETGVIREDPNGTHIVFQEDYTFKTPSGAAMMLIGGPANDWTEWKSKFGKTLDELNRREAAGDTATE